MSIVTQSDSNLPQRNPARAGQGGFFTIYKKGQGVPVRLGTAAAAAIVGLLVVSMLLYPYLPLWLQGMGVPDRAAQFWKGANFWRLVVCAVFIAGWAALVWGLTNKPKNAEFLIDTDGEMKKVSWTSIPDLVGSTKIVVIFMFLIAGLLFIFDILFGVFFNKIGLLRHGPFG